MRRKHGAVDRVGPGKRIRSGAIVIATARHPRPVERRVHAAVVCGQEGRLTQCGRCWTPAPVPTNRLPLARRTAEGLNRRPPGNRADRITVAVGSGHFELAAFLLIVALMPRSAAGWTAPINSPGPQDRWPAAATRRRRVPDHDQPGAGAAVTAHGANPDARDRKPPAGITRLNPHGHGVLAARTPMPTTCGCWRALAPTRACRRDESMPLIVAGSHRRPGEDPGTEPEVLEAQVRSNSATISTPSTTTGNRHARRGAARAIGRNTAGGARRRCLESLNADG